MLTDCRCRPTSDFFFHRGNIQDVLPFPLNGFDFKSLEWFSSQQQSRMAYSNKSHSPNFRYSWVAQSIPSSHDRVADFIATACFDIPLVKTKAVGTSVLCYVTIRHISPKVLIKKKSIAGSHCGTVYTASMLFEALAARARNDEVMRPERRSTTACIQVVLHGLVAISSFLFPDTTDEVCSSARHRKVRPEAMMAECSSFIILLSLKISMQVK